MLTIETIYGNIRRYTHLVIDGALEGLCVVGSGGTGKSYAVNSAIRERLGAENRYVRNSHASAFGLYRLLHEFRKEPVLVLEDIEQIFKSTVHCGLLRAATAAEESEFGPSKKVIDWNSALTQDQDSDLPSSFEFKGGVILIANELPETKFFQALLTRIPLIKIDLPPAEIFAFMRKLTADGYTIQPRGKDPVHLGREDCERVIRFLEGQSITNMRTLNQALQIYHVHRDDEWEEMLSQWLRRRPQTRLELVKNLLARDIPTTKRIEIYSEMTGKSRSTYHEDRRKVAGEFSSNGEAT